jgi:hypothetical protein
MPPETGDPEATRTPVVRQVAEGPWLTDEDASYQPGQKVHRTWGEQAVRPGIPDRTSPQGQPSYREGDTVRMTVWPFLDADSRALRGAVGRARVRRHRADRRR